MTPLEKVLEERNEIYEFAFSKIQKEKIVV